MSVLYTPFRRWRFVQALYRTFPTIGLCAAYDAHTYTQHQLALVRLHSQSFCVYRTQFIRSESFLCVDSFHCIASCDRFASLSVALLKTQNVKLIQSYQRSPTKRIQTEFNVNNVFTVETLLFTSKSTIFDHYIVPNYSKQSHIWL